MYKEKEHTVNEKIITKKMLEEIGCIKQQYWLHINKEEIRAFVEEIR